MRKFLVVAAVLALLFILLLIFVILDSDLGYDFYFKKNVTVKEGSYTGRVIDAETGKPIEGAAVYMGWYTHKDLNILEGLAQLGGHSEYYFLGEALAFTDTDGRYKVPSEILSQKLHWRAKKPKVEVLIYKKGYVAYNNEMGFDGNERFIIENPREHFKKEDNLVILQPWKPGFSHYSHVEIINDLHHWASNQMDSKLESLYMWEWKKEKEKKKYYFSD